MNIRIVREDLSEERVNLRSIDGYTRLVRRAPGATLTVEFECEDAEQALKFRGMLAGFVRGLE